MGLFDFFKTVSQESEFDLSNYKYTSNDHVRYQGGKDISGHNYNCWRGIHIQNNVSGGQGFTVTIYNLDGNHPIWGNNVQMAPKQMKIVDKTSSYIKLRGYGTDSMGASFADYGLTIEFKSNEVDKIALHIYDRNIDIVYYEAEKNNSNTRSSSEARGAKPSLSTDIFEILAISRIIHECEDLETLEHVYNQKGNFNHPQICYDFGVAFLIKGDKRSAKKALIQGASYGIKYPCEVYNNPFIDAVGQCLAILMTQFISEDIAIAEKITCLSYVYLSRCIELHPRESHDSYRTRALLFKDHESPVLIRNIVKAIAGAGALVEPYIISDLYYAASAVGSPHRDALQGAQRIHNRLGDISIGVKDASEYSLDELALFGEKRHLDLFKALEQQYFNGQLDFSLEELKRSMG